MLFDDLSSISTSPADLHLSVLALIHFASYATMYACECLYLSLRVYACTRAHTRVRLHARAHVLNHALTHTIMHRALVPFCMPMRAHICMRMHACMDFCACAACPVYRLSTGRGDSWRRRNLRRAPIKFDDDLPAELDDDIVDLFLHRTELRHNLGLPSYNQLYPAVDSAAVRRLTSSWLAASSSSSSSENPSLSSLLLR